MDFYWYIILFVAIILKILFYLCWFYSRQRRLAGVGRNELSHSPNPHGTLSRPPPYPGIDADNPAASPVGSFPEPPPYSELDEHAGKPPPYHAVVAMKEAQSIQSQNAPAQLSHNALPHVSHNALPQVSHHALPQVSQDPSGLVSHNTPLLVSHDPSVQICHNALPQVSQETPHGLSSGPQEVQVSQHAPVQPVAMTTGVIDSNTHC